MWVTIWSIKVNETTEQFATSTTNVEKVIQLYKEHFESKHKNKAFNFKSLERYTAIRILTEQEEGQ